MKYLSTLVCLTVLAGLAGHGFAATAAKPKPAPATPVAPVPEDPLPTPDAPAPVPPPAPVLKLDDYFNEATAAASLSDPEKKEIEGLYFADGTLLTNILNNDSLSPLEKAQQASDLRNLRNAKIGVILLDVDRRKAFFLVESKYRVALLELAAEGGLVAPAAPAK